MKQSLLLVSLSVLISLTGCGGGSSSSVERPPEPPPVTPPPVTPAPTVTAIEPSSGTIAGGTPVTITGTDFTGATAVKFGGNNAQSFTVASATSITAVSPAGSGTVLITVTTAGGTSATSEVGRFTYIAPPPASAAGLWQGSTDNDQAIGGLVRAKDDGGNYWMVYSSAASPAPASITAANAAGFIAGLGTETASAPTEGSFSSSNLVEFNFAGAGAATGSLDAGYIEKAKFGKALTGAGAGIFSSTPVSASPTTLTNGVASGNLPLPGMMAVNVSAVSDVKFGGTDIGDGTATGTGLLDRNGELKFSASGPTTTTFTGTMTNDQDYALGGDSNGFSDGVFTPTSGTSMVTACDPPANLGCQSTPLNVSSPLVINGGSITAAGGAITVVTNLVGAEVTTALTFAPMPVPTTPAAPTFTNGGTPWTISATGTPVLSGSLAFAPYTATIDLGGGVSATLGVATRVLAINGTQGTLTYDAGTNTLRLANATLTDTSGSLTCTGHASICTSGTFPSTATPLTGEVVVAIDTPAAGQYQAQVFIGSQSSPISTLTFEGDLSSAPTTTVNFTTDYLAAYETPATLAAVQGSHIGSAGVGNAIQPGASFSIAADGTLTAGVEASGCTYVGTVTPAANANAYNVALTFTAGMSCTYTGPFTGAAFFDENNKLTITATNADRNEGFLFIAQ